MKEESALHFFLKNSAAGTAGGIAVCIVGHPFDTLKVRLQSQPIENPIYKGLTDCCKKTYSQEGIGGFYKGVGSPLVGQMFFRAIMFSSYREIGSALGGKKKRLEPYKYYIAGAGTGFCSAFVEGPIDLLKTKMQTDIINSEKNKVPLRYKHVFHAGQVIIGQHGPRAIFQGLMATHMRNIPACGIYFGFYELARTYFTPVGGSVADITLFQQFCSGGLAGFCYWSMTYPTDVIKSCLQSDDLDPKTRQYKGIFDCVRKLYAEGGLTRFFKGLTPCMMRSIPANAAMLFTFEKVRILIS